MSKDELQEMRKQAYLDAHNSGKANAQKYNSSNPILQNNDFYV